MKTAVEDDVSDMEERIDQNLEEEPEEEGENSAAASSSTTDKTKKARAPKKTAVTKKKNSTPRPLPRPYKNLSLLKLTTGIAQLQERVEVTDNRLKTYSLRLRKLLVEQDARKND